MNAIVKQGVGPRYVKWYDLQLGCVYSFSNSHGQFPYFGHLHVKIRYFVRLTQVGVQTTFDACRLSSLIHYLYVATLAGSQRETWSISPYLPGIVCTWTESPVPLHIRNVTTRAQLSNPRLLEVSEPFTNPYTPDAELQTSNNVESPW